ncbi:retinol-binding protein pinta [Diaphorina citri]|uniref:Retinol-binding protein pinta n=1 Tax=Diaphorina citri TaxID=121845 RepID=A0A1S4EGI4_DIACI|nr:retinol-binding protein pinta [Diaphorina citri]
MNRRFVSLEDGDSDEIKRLKEKLSKTEEELKKEKTNSAALKSQADSVGKEYDRLLKEHEKVQKVVTEQGDKKDETIQIRTVTSTGGVSVRSITSSIVRSVISSSLKTENLSKISAVRTVAFRGLAKVSALKVSADLSVKVSIEPYPRNLLRFIRHSKYRLDVYPRNLLRFIRHSKYRLDVCKKKIENFYRLRTKVPEWFQNRDLNQQPLRDLLELGPFLPLLKKDSSKRTTIIIRPTVHDASRFSQNDLMKLDNMVFDLAMEKDETINIYGVNAVLDLKDVRVGHVLTPGNIKKAVHSWQNCYPVSPKRFDFIFAPIFVDVALDVFRRFMSPKLRARVHVHGKNLDSLHQIVSPEILPVEYGGTAGTLQELIGKCAEKG